MIDPLASLRTQLTEIEYQLQAIQQRKANSSSLPVDVSLQLLHEEKRLKARIAELRARLHGVVRTNQLRPPVSHFEGRKADVTELVRMLGDTGDQGAVVVISGSHGLSGVGKTELAYLVAQHLTATYTDAQLLLDLRGSMSQPLSPEHALQTILRVFNPAAILPNDVAQLQLAYRSLLHDKAVLILADDAASAAQVQPLLPPAGSALIITSRQHLHISGPQNTHLQPLAQEEAEQLLTRLSWETREHAPRLALLSGNLPLALQINASMLAQNPTVDPRAYMNRLEKLYHHAVQHNTQSDNDERSTSEVSQLKASIDATLQLAYDALNDLEKQTLQRLGIFVTSFSQDAARSVLDGSFDFNDVFELLCRCNLLEWNPLTERYIMHSLVRRFALHQLGIHAYTVWVRYATYFAQVARYAEDQLYLKGDRTAGLALFDQERAHIDACWAWARQEPHTTERDDLLLAFANATTYLGDMRYDKQTERIPQLTAQLEAARRLSNRRAEGLAFGNLGLAYYALGDVRKAISCYEQAREIARETEDRQREGLAVGNLGNAYYTLGDARHAIDYYQQHLVIAREMRDRRGEGRALGNLGLAHTALGESEQALPYYEQALAIAREMGDQRGEGAALGNLGKTYAALGHLQQAIEQYQQRLKIARDIGDRRGEAQALGNLGSAYHGLNRIPDALSSYEQHRLAARDIGDRRGEAQALGNLGNLSTVLGDFKQAISYYEQHHDLSRKIGDRRAEGTALGNLGSAYYALGNARQAITYYKQRLMIAREMSDRRSEGAALSNLGMAYAALGVARQAITYQEEALDSAREVGDRRAEGVALGGLGNAYTALGDARQAIIYHNQALAISRELGDRRGEGADLGNIGLAYATLGQHSQAMVYHEQRLAISREIGDRRGEAQALGGIGSGYVAMGNPDKALTHHTQALELARTIGDRRGEGQALGNIGLAHAAMGQPRQAIPYYEEYLKIAREIGDRRAEGQTLGNLGNAYAAMGNPQQAMAYDEQVLLIMREIGDRRSEAITSWNLGWRYEAQNDLSRAVALMQVCVDFEQDTDHPDAAADAERLEEVKQRLREQQAPHNGSG